jgi:NAD(P)-dependent dehydrogenase (short-subunit alcohol dehydrogenase family)
MDGLAGKTAVVTGAASGMGRAFADRFAAAGMKVVLADIEGPALDGAVDDLVSGGAEAMGVVTDVSDPDAVAALADRAIERFGRVNVVCNNAGVAADPLTSADQLDLKSWKWVMDVNVWGVVHGHQVFLPHLLDHGDGHIVNTASMAGHFPGHGAYGASKWAVVGITEGLYQHLRATGSTVGVSCLCPGWVHTRITEAVRNRPEWAAPSALDEPTPEAEAAMAFVRDQVISGRPPSEVADLVHDAIVADRFWIFTDLTMVAALSDRFAAVLENRNPEVSRFLRDD